MCDHRAAGFDEGAAACFWLEERHVEARHHEHDDRTHKRRAVDILVADGTALFSRATCRYHVRGLEEELRERAMQRVAPFLVSVLVGEEVHLRLSARQLVGSWVAGVRGLRGVRSHQNELLVDKRLRDEVWVEPDGAAEPECSNEQRALGPRALRAEPRRMATHRVAREYFPGERVYSE